MEALVTKSAGNSEAFNTEIRKEIEAKFAKKRQYLEQNLRRAQFEENIHLKQEKYNKYERLFENYAFPANEFKFDDHILKQKRITE